MIIFSITFTLYVLQNDWIPFYVFLFLDYEDRVLKLEEENLELKRSYQHLMGMLCNSIEI